MSELDVVTGAFGYAGRHIAARLLERGGRVRTLTAHPNRVNPLRDRIETAPFDFDRPLRLVESLRGVSTLYNTYWVRFPRKRVTFDATVQNTRLLFEAASAAGVRRVVHVSITNPYEGPLLPYFAGKAAVEGTLMSSPLSYAIVRPTVMFGGSDVFINNIAWMLRRFPFFAVAGDGRYRLQPVCVDDVADLCVDAAVGAERLILDAAGPEVFTFDELVSLIGETVGSKSRIVHVPPLAAVGLARVIGSLVRDVVLTRGELRGLMAELIVSRSAPTGRTRLSDWLAAKADTVGSTYVSELDRNYRAPRRGRLGPAGATT